MTPSKTRYQVLIVGGGAAGLSVAARLRETESFPFDQHTERFSMYAVKRGILPQLSWHGMLKGRV